MPESPTSPNASPLRAAIGIVTLALVIAFAALALQPDAFAQDGTGAATPTPPTDCLPPTASVDPDQDLSVVPTVVPTEPPAASPEASPVASPAVAVGVTNAAALQEDLTNTTRVLASCLSEGKFAQVAGMTGDTFRGLLLGVPDDVDAATYTELAPALIPVPWRIVSITGIEGTGQGMATANVVYQTANALRAGTWTFELTGSGETRTWIVAAEATTDVSPPSGAAQIGVTMSDDGFDLSEDEVAGRSVVLAGQNDDEEAHEILVVTLGFGVSADSLLTNPGPALPAGVEFIGQLTVPADTTGALVLTDLEPGRYTIVDLLPNEEGVPHLAEGMSATFTVVAP